MKILIAPPSPQKAEVLKRATSDEFDALAVADQVFVLGYSFPRTDGNQMVLLQRAVNQRKTPVKSVTAVNFKAPEQYFDEIEARFKPCTMRRFNDGFVDFVTNGGY